MDAGGEAQVAGNFIEDNGLKRLGKKAGLAAV
jgi:hypothetical protein